MRILPLAIPLLILLMALKVVDSPHGNDLEISCSVCHSPQGWEVKPEIYSFDHSKTNMPLEGQHASLNCRLCHPSLVFSDAETDCFACHTDMHYQTVGPDCDRCHTTESWIVTNITDLHRQGRFPLFGPHLQADCMDCHPSASFLRFEPLRIECIDCHQEDYASATNPNHVQGNISTDCIECHSMNAFAWGGAGFNHSFFPLTGGHEVYECSRCHNGNDYSNVSPDCFSCHQTDYNNSSNPSHVSANLSTDCLECHTTVPGWKPAEFRVHDSQFFPIFSGRHQGEWNECTDCHTNTGNYAVFTCLNCHEHNQAKMDDKHSEISGYQYLSTSCLDCHPRGEHD